MITNFDQNKQLQLYAALQDKNITIIKQYLDEDIAWLFEPLDSGKATLLSVAVHTNNNTILKIVIESLRKPKIDTEMIVKKLIATDDPVVFSYIVSRITSLLNHELTWENQGIGTALHYVSAHNKFLFIGPIIKIIGKEHIDRMVNHKTPLHYAVSNSAMEAAKKIIKHGANAIQCFAEAVAMKNTASNKLLIDVLLHDHRISAPKIDAVTTNWYLYEKKITLSHAIFAGNLATIKQYAKQNKAWLKISSLLWQIDQSSHMGSPLHYAAAIGQLDVIRFILNELNRDELIALSRYNQTPLHYALLYGQVGAVKMLVDNNLYLKDLNNLSQTPLKFAVMNKLAKMIEILTNNPNITAEDIDNVPPVIRVGGDEDNYITSKKKLLLAAIKNGNLQNVESISSQNVEWLKTKLYDPALFMYGQAIHFAAAYGQIDILEFIVSKLGQESCNSDIRDSVPLDFAAMRNQCAAGKALLELGACIPRNCSSVFFGVYHKAADFLEFLLSQSQVTAKMIQDSFDFGDLIKGYFHNKFATLVNAISRMDIDTVQHYISQNSLWLKLGLDANGSTALHLAVLMGSYQLVTMFTECLSKDEEITLLEDIVDVNRSTPLDYAILTDNLSVFSELYTYHLLSLLKKLFLDITTTQVSKYASQPELVSYLKTNFNIENVNEVASYPSVMKLWLPPSQKETAEIFAARKEQQNFKRRIMINIKFCSSSLSKYDLDELSPADIATILLANPSLVVRFFNQPHLFNLLLQYVIQQEDGLENLLLSIPNYVCTYPSQVTALILHKNKHLQPTCPEKSCVTFFIEKLSKKNIDPANFICAELYHHGLFEQQQDLGKAIVYYRKISSEHLDLYLKAQMMLADIYCLPNEQGVIESNNIALAKMCWENVVAKSQDRSLLTEDLVDLRDDAIGNLSATLMLDTDVDLTKERLHSKDELNTERKRPDNMWVEDKINTLQHSFWAQSTKVEWVNVTTITPSGDQLIFPNLT